jgi:hypothetical protein
MTAKESLKEFVEELSEQEAECWLYATATNLADGLHLENGMSATDLLKLPAPIRSVILKLFAAEYSAADAELDLAEAEAWERGTASDIDLIDA